MIRGSCLCGGVEFEIARAEGPFELCHCPRCRKASGSAFVAGLGVRVSDFRLLAGADLIRTYEAPIREQPPAYRVAFCSRCGSPVPDPPPQADWFEIAAGLLDDDPVLRPDRHIFVECRSPWFGISDSLPRLTKPELVALRRQPREDDDASGRVASLDTIEFRTVRHEDDEEFFSYQRLFWDLPPSQNPYFGERTDAFVESWVRFARENEAPGDTFSGIALHGKEIVGLHVLRFYEEYEGPAAHIAGLWVHPDYRRMGIARRLKADGEAWARRRGARFLNTNVMPDNTAMLRLNEAEGFRVFRFNMRKDL